MGDEGRFERTGRGPCFPSEAGFTPAGAAAFGETYLTVLSHSHIFERWPAMELNFIDQDADAARMSRDLTDGAAESWSLFLYVRV